MKSHSNSLLSIAAGILKDASLAYPTDRSGFVKDLARLTRLVETRGLGIFTLDLPAFDERLLDGLESGRLSTHGSKCYSRKVLVPRLFSGLYLRVFDESSMLRCDADVNAIAFLRQLNCLGKKIEIPCSKKRELQAIEEYIHVESTIRPPSLRWESDSLGHDGYGFGLHLRDCMDDDLPLLPREGKDRKGDHHRLFEGCQRISDIISREIGSYYPDHVIDENEDRGVQLGLKHGPGAVAEKRGSYINKYDFSNWSAKLDALYPFHTYGRMPNDIRDKPRNHEVPARLICVPKTAKGPRIIASEPSEHMYCQMLLKEFLEGRVKRTVLGSFIDFKKQSLSSELVKTSSLDRSLATIDLSSASDRLSCWLVERVFRKNHTLLTAIHASRTRWIHVPQRNEYLKLKKFASQGTAITFPVQTIVFLVIALAASLSDTTLRRLPSMTDKQILGLITRLRGRVRVYGDDIIIPVHGYVRITQLMHDLGLKVNTNKSFYRGNFRESCGSDYYKGYDVTPIKPKCVIPDNPASRVAVLDTTNNLFYKGYWHASEQLRNRHNPRSRRDFGVMGLDAGTQGYGSFSAQTTLARYRWSHCIPGFAGTRVPNRELSVLASLGVGRHRWNSSLHRFEFRRWTIQSIVKIEPYQCGYTALLEQALRPSGVDLFSKRGGTPGVAGRPRYREVAGWVASSDLF